jgi:hypothetical protein
MRLNIFKKFRKDDTVIDLAALHKRGILKSSASKETLDLTNSSASSANSSSTESFPLGFLGSLAGSAEASPETPVSTVIEDESKARLNGILRSINAKMDSTYNKIYKLSDRIDLLEKKLDRLERRGGI